MSSCRWPRARRPRPTRAEYKLSCPWINLNRNPGCVGLARYSRFKRRAISRISDVRRAKHAMKSSVTLEFTVYRSPRFGIDPEALVQPHGQPMFAAFPASARTDVPSAARPRFLRGLARQWRPAAQGVRLRTAATASSRNFDIGAHHPSSVGILALGCSMRFVPHALCETADPRLSRLTM